MNFFLRIVSKFNKQQLKGVDDKKLYYNFTHDPFFEQTQDKIIQKHKCLYKEGHLANE